MWSSFPSRFSWSWGLSRSNQNNTPAPASSASFSTPLRSQTPSLPPLGHSLVVISIDQYNAIVRYFSTACDLEGKTNLHAAMVYVEKQMRNNNPLFQDYNQASKVVHEMSKLDRDNRAHMKEIDVEKFKICLQETNIRVSPLDTSSDVLSDRDKYADLLRQRSQGEFVSLSPRLSDTYGRSKAGMDISSRFSEMSATLANEERRLQGRREEKKSESRGGRPPSPSQDDGRMTTMSDDEADDVPSGYEASRFAEVSAAERAAVQAIYNGPDSEEIITIKFNIELRRRDVRRLGPARWLNDDVINFYMKMLQERDSALCTSDSSRTPSYFFSSLFMLKLNEKDAYNFGNVKRWTKSFNVFAMSRIYFPINVAGSHWTLVVVEMSEKLIRYYDSMSGSGHRYVNHIMRWLIEEGRSRHGIEVNQNEWTLQHQGGTDVPQQTNGFDCGVFTIMCADFLCDSLSLSYSQEDMPHFRIKIGVAIMRGSLDYPI